MAILRDPHNFVAYLPRNDFILLNAAGINSTVEAGKWWNPRDGTFLPGGVGPAIVRCLGPGQQNCSVDVQWCQDSPQACGYCGTGFLASPTWACAFLNPLQNEDFGLGLNDFALHFDVDPGYLSGWHGTSTHVLRAWEGRSIKGQPMGIDGAVYAENGALVSGVVRLSDDEMSRRPARPAVGRDGFGDFAVVWQDDRNADGRREVYFRWVGRDGEPTSAQLQLSTDWALDDTSPALALEGTGDAIVAWRRKSTLGSEIVLVRMEKGSTQPLLTESIAHCAPEGGPRLPLVVASLDGTSTVIWVERNVSTGRDRLHGLRLSNQLELGSETDLSSNDAEWIFPLRIFASQGGTVTVEWEALGGSGGDRIVRGELSATGGALVSHPIVVHEFETDEEPAVVE
jgi:hypothetical protein